MTEIHFLMTYTSACLVVADLVVPADVADLHGIVDLAVLVLAALVPDLERNMAQSVVV